LSGQARFGLAILMGTKALADFFLPKRLKFLPSQFARVIHAVKILSRYSSA